MPAPTMDLRDVNVSSSRRRRATMMLRLSLVLSLAAQTSAFYSSQVEQFPARPVRVRTGRSSAAASANSSGPSKRSLPKSFLQYSNDAASAPGDDAGDGWWSTVFQSRRREDEQETVDEYLEFLDRRYNRLHDSKPVSTLEWLRLGSPNRNDLRAKAHQGEDSLYVLGVAGLASEKLLQKHHLVPPRPEGAALSTYAESNPLSIVDVKAESDETGTSTFIKKVLVPIIRQYAIFQQAKRTFVRNHLDRARAATVATMTVAGRSLLRAPAAAGRAFLDVGGGKRNIVATIAAVSALLVLLRPVLQAAFTESSVAGTMIP